MHNQLNLETRWRRKKINKFKESAWKSLYYFSSEFFALSVIYNEPWFTNTRYFWEGPGDQTWPDQKIKFVPQLVRTNPLFMWKSARIGFILIAMTPLSLIDRLKLKALYMYTGGFYVYSIFALVFWETRRSDFYVSMAHHFASVTLIVLSYILRYVRKSFCL